jgi:hypothetical protein
VTLSTASSHFSVFAMRGRESGEVAWSGECCAGWGDIERVGLLHRGRGSFGWLSTVHQIIGGVVGV